MTPFRSSTMRKRRLIMSGHTTGPWFVGAQNDGLHIINEPPRPSTDYPRHDAQVAAIAHVYHGDSAEANARLIALAPEMLVILKAAYHALESYAHGNAAPHLAQAVALAASIVLAKAEDLS